MTSCLLFWDILDPSGSTAGSLHQLSLIDARLRWLIDHQVEQAMCYYWTEDGNPQKQIEASLQQLGHSLTLSCRPLSLKKGASLLDQEQFLRQEAKGLLEAVPGNPPATLLNPEQIIWGHVLLTLKEEGLWRGPLYRLTQTGNYRAQSPVASRLDEEELAPESFWHFAQSAKPILEDVAYQLGLVGNHPSFLRLLESSQILSETKRAVLLQGEMGTGKALYAELIHRLGPRREEPFVALDCSRLPPAYLSAAIFGEKTSQGEDAKLFGQGYLELGQRGSFFLNGLEYLSPGLQDRLHETLTSETFTPDGSDTPQPLTARVILGLNTPLRVLQEREDISPDLANWLRPNRLLMMPLRERPGDIPPLAQDILRRINRSLQQARQFDHACMRFLQQQPWPGNLTDLRIAVEQAVLHAEDTIIRPDDFMLHGQLLDLPPHGTAYLPDFNEGFALDNYMSLIRVQIIEKALHQAGGNQSLAARLLKISPQAVHQFIKAQRSGETKQKQPAKKRKRKPKEEDTPKA